MSTGISKISKILGPRIKKVRQTRGYSQGSLARQVGVLPSTINHYESSRRLPSLSVAVHLAEILSVSLDQLTGTGQECSTPTKLAELLEYASKLDDRDIQTLVALASQLASKR